MGVGWIAQAVGLTSGGLSIALDRLERAGSISRRRHEQDRRSVVVEPTELAERMGGEVFGALSLRVDKALRLYGEAELSVIGDFLRRIRLAIGDDATAPAG